MPIERGKHLHILLDTHILLWALTSDKRLKPDARELITDRNHYVAVSIVSVWEVAIKVSVGKLDSSVSVQQFLDALNRFEVDLLAVEPEHVEEYAQLPLHHRDPFDRMLIAQAKHEGMHLLTADPQFKAYDVPLVDL